MSVGLLFIFIVLVAYAGGLSIVAAYIYLNAAREKTFRVFLSLQALVVGTNFVDVLGLVLSADAAPGEALPGTVHAINGLVSGALRSMLCYQLLVAAWILVGHAMTPSRKAIVYAVSVLYGCIALAEPALRILGLLGFRPLSWVAYGSLRTIVTLPLLVAGLFSIGRWVAGKRRLFHPLFSKGMEDLRVPCLLLSAILPLQAALIAWPGLPALLEIQRLLWAVFFGWMGYWNIRLGLRLLCLQRVRDQTPDMPSVDSAIRLFSLTNREGEVCGLLLEGLVLKEVAARLGISANTARNHLASVFKKAGVTNRMELVYRILREDRS